LGQLHHGTEALSYFTTGLNLMLAEKKEMETQQRSKDDVMALSKQISTAYCSLAELYTTDLCDEDHAEIECERLLRCSIGACAANPDAFQALVNLRLIQGRRNDAKRYLARCVQLISQSPEEASYELRVKVVKDLLELDGSDHAVDMLERLLEEDDSSPELWYLMAVAYRQQEELDSALDYTTRAQQMLSEDPAPDEVLSERLVNLTYQLLQSGAKPVEDGAQTADDVDMEDS